MNKLSFVFGGVSYKCLEGLKLEEMKKKRKRKRKKQKQKGKKKDKKGKKKKKKMAEKKKKKRKANQKARMLISGSGKRSQLPNNYNITYYS